MDTIYRDSIDTVMLEEEEEKEEEEEEKEEEEEGLFKANAVN